MAGVSVTDFSKLDNGQHTIFNMFDKRNSKVDKSLHSKAQINL